MKMLIKKIVAESLVCAVVVGFIPFLHVNQVAIAAEKYANTYEDITFTSEEESATTTVTQIVNPTTAPTQTPEVVTSPGITTTPTVEPMSTPFVEVFIQFIDGDNCNMGIARPQYDGDITYVTVKIIPPYEEKEGYRFLGWENNNGLYQPDEEIKVYQPQDCMFYAKWEKVEPTITPAATSVVTTGSVTATPIVTTEGPMPTPLADPFIVFVDGDNDRFELARPQEEGYTTYLIIKLIEPYEKKEGYRFLGWENNSGLYQPGEVVKVCGEDGYVFYAKWEKVESITTPVATSTVTNGSATATPVVTTTEPEATATVEPKATATETATAEPEATPTVTPIATETSNVDSPVKASEEGIEELEKKTNADTEKKEKAKKASLEIITKANKKFVVGKKYRIKVKRINTNKKIRWFVSNKKVATINEKTGVLKAKKAGKVTITVICGKLKKKITLRIS